MPVDPQSELPPRRFNHRLHQLKRIKHAAKSRLRIRNNWQKVVGITLITRLNAVRPLNLIGAPKGIIDAFNHRGYGIRWVERLVGIHAGRQIGIRRHLPTGKINRFDARFRLL